MTPEDLTDLEASAAECAAMDPRGDLLVTPDDALELVRLARLGLTVGDARKNWVGPTERDAYVSQIAAMLWGAFDAEDKAKEIVEAFEQRVMTAIHSAGWDIEGKENAWDFVARLTRERDEAIARMQLAERDANVAETKTAEARRFHSVLHDCAATSAHMHTMLKHEHSCAADSINSWRARAETAEKERDKAALVAKTHAIVLRDMAQWIGYQIADDSKVSENGLGIITAIGEAIAKRTDWAIKAERERDAAREVLRYIHEMGGPCPICKSLGDCTQDCSLKSALGDTTDGGDYAACRECKLDEVEEEGRAQGLREAAGIAARSREVPTSGAYAVAREIWGAWMAPVGGG